MATQLSNQYMFDPRLLDEAVVVVPDGAFIAVEDLAFQENGLGRKIAQTMVVDVDGRKASVCFVQDDGTPYELVLASDHPQVLGTFQEILGRHSKVYGAMVAAFGGPGAFTPTEMVIALQAPQTVSGAESPAEAVARARKQAARASWVVRNRMDALAGAPVKWSSVGL